MASPSLPETVQGSGSAWLPELSSRLRGAGSSRDAFIRTGWAEITAVAKTR